MVAEKTAKNFRGYFFAAPCSECYCARGKQYERFSRHIFLQYCIWSGMV